MKCTISLLAMGFALGLATSAASQTAPSDHEWSDGTTINAFGGLSVASSDAGALVGGGAGWEMTPLFGLEGRLGWADGVGSGDTFAASLTLNANLQRPRPLVPFVKGGIGLYRVSFASSATLPEFYSRRVNQGPSPVKARRIFADPTLVVGTGVNIFASRHFAIRPELGLTCVFDGWRFYTVPTVTVHVAYHFESHPVTPSRTR